MVDSASAENRLDGITSQAVQAASTRDIIFNSAPAGPVGMPKPAQLPAVARHFINRVDEQAALTRLLHSKRGPGTVRLAVIDGMAGIGKTALAVFWAHHVAEEFPDGQLYVNLRGIDPITDPLDPATAIRGFLAALGMSGEQIPVGTEEQQALLRSLLQGKKILLLLDNASGVDQVRPLLPNSPSCLVLVTSRDRLSGLVAHEGADRISLNPLTDVEARALLRSYLAGNPADQRMRDEPEAVRELIRHCAHLPLALAIAATRVEGKPDLPIGRLVNELADERSRLDGLDLKKDRNANVRAVFSLSYKSLTPAAARLFRLLSLPTGTNISLAAVDALAGEPSDALRVQLTELVEANLLDEYRPDRFRIHDLLRVYASELVAREESVPDQRAAGGRLLDFYLHTSHNAVRKHQPQRAAELELEPPAERVRPLTFESAESALRWWETERLNLVRAVERGPEYGFWSHSWQIAQTLSPFFELRNYGEDWIRTNQAALGAARHLGDRAAEANALRRLGAAHYNMHRYEDAIAGYQAAITLCRDIGDRAGEGWALSGLGIARTRHGQHEQAILDLEQALEIQQANGDTGSSGHTLDGLGVASRAVGLDEKAIDYLQRALPRHDRAFSRAYTLHNLGDAYLGIDDYATAITYYRQAVTLRDKIGHDAGQSESLRQLVAAYRKIGDFTSAGEVARRAEAVRREQPQDDRVD